MGAPSGLRAAIVALLVVALALSVTAVGASATPTDDRGSVQDKEDVRGASDGDRQPLYFDVAALVRSQLDPGVEDRPGRLDVEDEVGQSGVLDLFEAVRATPDGTERACVADGGERDGAADRVAAGDEAQPATTNGSIGFVGAPYSEHEGDVATIALDLAGGDAGYVTVRAENADYEATIELTDVEGRAVTIDANTFLMGHDEARGTFTAENATASFTESGANASLGGERFEAPAAFRLRTYEAPPRSGANATDASRLELAERSTTGVTTWVAPVCTELDVDDPDRLLEDATQARYAAHGDVVIAQVEASGIYGYLGENASSFDAAGQHVSFRLQDPIPVVWRDGPVVPVNGENTTLVRDDHEDTFYVAFETDAVEELAPANEWDLRFEIGTRNPYVASDGENDTAVSAVGIEERAITFTGNQTHDGRMLVERDSSAEITATTSLAPGTDATYAVETPRTTFSGQVTVDEDRTLTATVDLRGTEASDALERIEFVEVGGDTAAVTEGRVVVDGERDG